MTRELIREFKTGTQIWRVSDTCDKCGGTGQFLHYGTCFKCGGTGIFTSTVTEMTPEHERKLAEARRERMQKVEEENRRIQAEQEAEEERKAREEAAQKAISQHLFNVGDKITVSVTLQKTAWFNTRSFSGYGTTTTWVYTFVDGNGNKLVWKTTGSLERVVDGICTPIEEGEKITIKATVKAHGEYQGEKQTELQRVKLA